MSGLTRSDFKNNKTGFAFTQTVLPRPLQLAKCKFLTSAPRDSGDWNSHFLNNECQNLRYMLLIPDVLRQIEGDRHISMAWIFAFWPVGSKLTRYGTPWESR